MPAIGVSKTSTLLNKGKMGRDWIPLPHQLEAYPVSLLNIYFFFIRLIAECSFADLISASGAGLRMSHF